MNMTFDDGTMGLLSFDDYNFSNGGGSGIVWNDVINNGYTLASQIIGAWGRNPTQQTTAGGRPIGGGYSPAAEYQAQAEIERAKAAAANRSNSTSGTNTGGLGLDDTAGSIVNTITRNPLLFLGLGVGAYLLFKDPPRSRR